uniref:Phorbol-12-myristate-13-acetate-induced protein 1 n=1 Tax=Microcebus murinus TaxID=30608 RepID=A0A8C5Y904_MICMU
MPVKKARKNAQPSPTRTRAGTGRTAETAREGARCGVGMQLQFLAPSLLFPPPCLPFPGDDITSGRRMCSSTQENRRQTAFPAETTEFDSQTFPLRNLTDFSQSRYKFHQLEDRSHCN